MWNEQQCYRGVSVARASSSRRVLRRDRRRLPRNPLRMPAPTVYLSGTSPEAIALAAEHGDVHLLDEQSHGIAAVASELRGTAAEFGREVRAGSNSRSSPARTPTRPGPGSSGSGVRCIPKRRRPTCARSLWTDPVGPASTASATGSRSDWSAVTRRGAGPVALPGRRCRGLRPHRHPHLEELHRVGEHLLHLVDPRRPHARWTGDLRMSTDFYWRIGMEATTRRCALRAATTVDTRAGTVPATSPRRSAAVNSTGTATSTTWRRW
ncbi:LLM class flavin-dependent oxidoreductase [Rhodococcus hoagii]|nr:LLM class flavin-dependent oxidoreductase [Prescottella equi]